MNEQSSSQAMNVQCVNCGTVIEAIPEGAGGVTCPVCQFYNDLSVPPAPLTITAEDLETNLGILMAQARTGGLDQDEIVRILRDELEFAAELAHTGRNFCVQLIDLGPSDIQNLPTLTHDRSTAHDRSTVLRGRSVGS